MQVWEKDEPEAAAADEEEAAGAATNGSAGTRESMEIVVSDMTDANGMYVQVGAGSGWVGMGTGPRAWWWWWWW